MLSEQEKENRRIKYHETMNNPELRKKLQGAKREYHQRIYQEKKNNPELWEKHLEQQRKYRKENPEVHKYATARSKLRNPEKWLLRSAKNRARDKNLEFTLELKDIKIPQYCPIMGQLLQYVHEGYSDYSPSIDRIDSSKGYTPDNIWVISSIANRMKWASTKEQLLTFCQGVLSLEGRDALC